MVDLHQHRTLVRFSAAHMSSIRDCINIGRYKVGYSIIEDKLGIERGKGDVSRSRKMRKEGTGGGCVDEIVVLHKLSDILQYLSVITIKITSNSRDNGKVCAMEITSTSSSIFPCWVPLGFLGSILFCWVPFSDFGANKRYVSLILSVFRDAQVVDVIDKDEDSNVINVSPLHGSSVFFIVYIIFPVIIVMALLLLGPSI